MIQTIASSSSSSSSSSSLNREDTYTNEDTSSIIVKKTSKKQSIIPPSSTKTTNKTQDKKYNDFINAHYSSSTIETKKYITNTRIGGGKTNADIKGGSFSISDEEYSTFLTLYTNAIIKKNKAEYLTEKQLETKCPILVDIDFRFAFDLETRYYTASHIQDLIHVYETCLLYTSPSPRD